MIPGGEDFGMAQRVAVVTGASSGIGQATLAHLAEAGWRVFGAQRRDPGSLPAGASWVELDVTDPEAVERAVHRVIADAGRIDALINNAGYALQGAIEDCTPEDMRAQMDTNFHGTFLMCRSVAPVMRAQGTGTIINVSSLAGILGVPFAGPYAASKFAVEGMTEALRHELRPFGVRVCLLEPGDIDTNLPANRRLVGGDTTSGPYADAYARYAANQARDEANCPGPDIVARRIAKILNAGNPPLRHVVGKFDQRVVVPAKKLLPQRLFEAAVRQAIGI